MSILRWWEIFWLKEGQLHFLTGTWVLILSQDQWSRVTFYRIIGLFKYKYKVRSILQHLLTKNCSFRKRLSDWQLSWSIKVSSIFYMQHKGLVQPKVKILSLVTQLCFVSSPKDFYWSLEHKIRIFLKETWETSVLIFEPHVIELWQEPIRFVHTRQARTVELPLTVFIWSYVCIVGLQP